MGRILVIFLMTGLLSGCYHWTRFKETGSNPPLTPTQDPTARQGYYPVRMPMPPETHETYSSNSLWRKGARAFFKDQRANNVGDVLTVLVKKVEKIEFKNETENDRNPNSVEASVGSFFGLEKHLPNPSGASPVKLIDASSRLHVKGKNDMKRKETFDFKVAATVTQVLPNGNLVILGRQEVRMNFEVREIVISGVVSPAEITSNNTITLDQIAEARVSYAGRGEGSDVQKTPYGSALLSQVMPF